MIEQPGGPVYNEANKEYIQGCLRMLRSNYSKVALRIPAEELTGALKYLTAGNVINVTGVVQALKQGQIIDEIHNGLSEDQLMGLMLLGVLEALLTMGITKDVLPLEDNKKADVLDLILGVLDENQHAGLITEMKELLQVDRE